MDRTSTPPAVMLCAVEPFGVYMLGCPRLPVLPPSLECSIFVGSGLSIIRTSQMMLTPGTILYSHNLTGRWSSPSCTRIGRHGIRLTGAVN